jgi:ribose transport system permease protein
MRIGDRKTDHTTGENGAGARGVGRLWRPGRSIGQTTRNPIFLSLVSTAVLVVVGGIIFPQIFSLNYLMHQLQIASFLGIAATGAMLVILIGGIDLSLPWTLTAAAIISSALSERGVLISVGVGLLVGIAAGLTNGLGAAILRIPSIIWSLAVNFIFLGVCVFITGGFMPQGHPTAIIKTIGIGRTLGVPNIVLFWCVLAFFIIMTLNRTRFGRSIYAVGLNEQVSFLSGIRTRRVIITVFMMAGICSALTGIMLSGYSNQAFQAMGDPYLIPAIAAVVIGGTSISGGRGSYAGTIIGVIFITYLSSLLAVLQVPEAGRQILLGVIIIAMTLSHSRRKEES